jgi:hypothetical protein
MRYLCALAMLSALAVSGQAAEYVVVKGQIIWDDAKPLPKLKPLEVTKDVEIAAKDKEFFDANKGTLTNEELVVNAKSKGIKNVFVWLAPEPTEEQLAGLKSKKIKDFPSFAAGDIHPDLAKPAKDSVEIDQPCCRFIPHVLAAREGQKLVIKNSAPVAHNAKYTGGDKNGEGNPIIPSGGAFTLPNPLAAEKAPIDISCSIHPWMKAWVRVFDHPYFAVTDADGHFEIKNAPVMKGKLRLFVWQEAYGFTGGAAGRFGKTIEVKAGTLDLSQLKFEVVE